ncbi:MAG: signal recognition particle protein Srp54 [Methanobacteriota archaeon]|nr:MAG: signal recognition particle protein Srp54 [Euryarchaeota archaeon]
MVLDSLGNALRNALRKIGGASHVDEALIKDVVRDIQRALLQADVNVQLALTLSKAVERRALGDKPPAGMSPREHVIHVIYEELVKILGKPRDLPIKPEIGKLANYIHKRGLTVGMVAADVHRPAAYDQLKQLGEQLGLPVFGLPGEKRAGFVVRKGLEHFADTQIVIVDSAGRHALDDDLIAEIKALAKLVNPDETILVLDASTGQQAGPEAKAFHEAAGVTAVIVTKLDGTAKGGGALSAVAETGAPIVFLGTGEHLEDLEKFEPPRFISRLLGMGDLESILEKAQEAIDEKEAEELTKQMLSGKRDLHVFEKQLGMLGKMGSLDKLMGAFPGMAGRVKDEDLATTQVRLKKFKVILTSMTDEEKTDPKLIKSSRVVRIARGSGTHPREVKELLKHFNMSRKAVKGLAGNRKMRKQLMKQLGAAGMDMKD